MLRLSGGTGSAIISRESGLTTNRWIRGAVGVRLKQMVLPDESERGCSLGCEIQCEERDRR